MVARSPRMGNPVDRTLGQVPIRPRGALLYGAMPHDAPERADPVSAGSPVRLLITAGPTHEPIDAVRYIANRSSGRLGIALANEGAERGWTTTLLLGPTPLVAQDTRVRTIRFSSTADLERLLAEHAPMCDCLIMAAAVADYRPRSGGEGPEKLRRSSAPITLELEPTPDLLAGISSARRPGQVLVGFALEPRHQLLNSARAKLASKGVDCIVANPLETLEGDSIEATLVEGPARDPAEARIGASTPGRVPKATFAQWLLDRLQSRISPGGAGKV